MNLVVLLGGKCVCNSISCWHIGQCGLGDLRLLQIDHVNGGGNKERQKKYTSTPVMYRHYLIHPDEARQKLQILCANCNWVKRHENNETPYAKEISAISIIP